MRSNTGLAVWCGLCIVAPASFVAAQQDVFINEVRIDQPSTDNDEYFELAGVPDLALDGLTYLVIGDSSGGLSGVIEEVTQLDGMALDAEGLFLVAESTFTLGTPDLETSLNFENSDNVTHLLVSGFTGSDGDDLDTDDDGLLDAFPWTEVIDAIGLLESDQQPPDGTEWAYGASLGFEDIGPDDGNVPGQVYRCYPDGTWMIGVYDLGFTDTPGEVNLPCTDMDGDGIPDDEDNCPEHYNPGQEDCDEDGIGDVCAIADGLSEDCNENEIPDECDIADGTSDDYDLNGVPDECDPDCNDNGVPDACDIDCDTGDCINHPIDCGGSSDDNANGIPDECEAPADIVINEILADPDADEGDANHDGVVNTTDDELVEIVNNTGDVLDLSGWELHDGVGVRHVFPADTLIEDLCAIVIFGGGDPQPGFFGGAAVQTASSGALGLNNSGDNVSLYDLDAVLRAQVEYGSEGGDNQSLTRDPDIEGLVFVKHSEANGSNGALFSPGTYINGDPFPGCATEDTDEDGVPDDEDNCPYHYNPGQEDCDEDGIGDVCAIADGISEDCNGNGVPDNCDIDDGYSQDDNGNGVPDECETVPDGLMINEFRIDEPGSDNNEYFELKGIPGTPLTAVTYLAIGGTGDVPDIDSGLIEAAINLSAYQIPDDGLFLAIEDTFDLLPQDVADVVFENGELDFQNGRHVTHLLVMNFTGADNDDLDTDDDGVLDIEPWAAVVDALGLIVEEQPPTEQTWAYGEYLGFQDIGPDDVYLPAQVYRCTPDDLWTIGSFDPADLTDTPSEENLACTGDECPWDLDENGVVDIDDLFAVLANWGPCPPPCPPYCYGDLDENCEVNIDDLFAVLANWGPCP